MENNNTQNKFNLVNENKSIKYNNNSSHQLQREIDIIIITQRIEELNLLLIKDNNHVNFELDKKENVYKLNHMKEINIGFFSNGIAIDDFPFYEYNSLESQRILNDIMEGYTPYVFEKNFPKGVLLKVLNKTKTKYNSYDIDKDSINSKNLYEIKCIKKINKISKDEFLSKMPNNILKDGKVYNIREDLSNIISGKKDKNSTYELIDYSQDRIEEINIFDINEIKKIYFEDKLKNNEKEQVLNFSPMIENKENQFFNEIKKEMICIFKINIPMLNNKNLTFNIDKRKKFKDLFDNIINILRTYSSLPKYKLHDNNKEISFKCEDYVLKTYFPNNKYFYDDSKNFEENKLFPTSVFYFGLNDDI
jgi:hypothetical protein